MYLQQRSKNLQQMKTSKTSTSIKNEKIDRDSVKDLIYSSSVKTSIFEPDFVEIPVSITRFLEDEYYLGNVGKSLYPIWKEELQKLFAPGNKVIEVVFSGATRTGKSTVANIIQLYNLYKLLCLRSPSLYYGLIESEPIAIALFNITEELAYEVTFKKFKGYMEMSPWFMERVTYNRTGSEIVLPKNIRILLGSRATHALGNAVIGGVMDEVDFSKTKASSYKSIYDTYINIRRRMEGQFMKYLKKDPPGTLCLISSVTNDVNSFLESRIKLASVHDNIKVYSYSQWEVKSFDYVSSERFYVYIGDNKHPAKIIYNKAEIAKLDSSKVLEVPVEYRQIFEDDLERALMDVAGKRPGYGIRTFLPIDKETFNNNRTPAFSKEVIEIGVHSKAFIQDFLTVKLPDQYKHLPRFIHVDLSKNKDKTGIACVTLTKIDPTQSIAYYYVDFVIAISSIVGDSIDYDKIRSFIVHLLDNGLPIQGISFDSFQSYDSLIYFEKLKRIPIVELQSVDKTSEPYYVLRNSFVNKRIDIYYHDLLFQELTFLQEDLYTGKIDHPPGGSKDVADALAGALYLCHKNQNVFSTVNFLGTTPPQVLDPYSILQQKKSIDLSTPSTPNNKQDTLPNIGL
jgi:hypothetical protein